MRQIHMDKVGVAIDLLESVGGLIGISVGEFLAGFGGHGVDELGVEEALLARFMATARCSS